MILDKEKTKKAGYPVFKSDKVQSKEEKKAEKKSKKHDIENDVEPISFRDEE